MKPAIAYTRLILILLLSLSLLAAQPAQSVQARPLKATISVNTTADEYNTNPAACSLREAIQAANTDAAFGGCPAGSGADVITLPAGTYFITLANPGGTNEDNNAFGDFDVKSSLTIQGAGAGSTIIDGNALDKVFALNPICDTAISVTIDGVTVRNGRNSQIWGASDYSFTGGGIDWCGYTSGNFTLSNSVVENNVNVNGYGGGLNTDSVNGYNGTITLSNDIFQNNRTQGTSNQESNGGAVNFFGEAPNVVIQNCTFQNNRTEKPFAVGGALYFRLGYGGNIQVHNTLVDSNSAGSMGGGIYANLLNSATVLTIDQNTRITNNISGNAATGTAGGGGMVIDGVGNVTPVTLSKIVVTGNSESAASDAGSRQGGAGIWIGKASVNISYSRIANNTLQSGSAGGSGLFKNTDTGAVNATNNWWGCSTGPSAAPCNTALLDTGSSGSLTYTPYLQVRTTAAPSTIFVNQISSLTATVNYNSAGTDVSANVERLIGLPVAWSATSGNLSGQQLAVQANGTMTATFTATQAGTSTVAAVVDTDGTLTGSNTAAITVNKANTTTTLVSESADPTLVSSPFTVTYSVTSATGTSPTAPTGNVTVSDGTDSCTGTLAAGSCSLTLTTPGLRSLTATYNGDANFNTSSSAAAPHTVNQPPYFSSAANATFTAGTSGSFNVTTGGFPATPMAITETGALPAGITFVDNGNGTATLSGTPAAGSGGVYVLTLGADNGIAPAASQTFTLTVNEAPVISSANNTTFKVGTAGNFNVISSAFPTATLSITAGSLPGGVTFVDQGNGTAVLSGTPAAGTGGVYTLTIQASNGVGSPAVQTFTLTVNQAPAITSAASITLTAGAAGNFIVTTSGYPATPMAISESGALPSGLTFTDNSNGTATLSGTPAAGTGGVYTLTFGADNGITPAASQTFTLTVNQAPTITSADNTTFAAEVFGSFTVTSSGFPTAALSLTGGSLPSGVSFVDNGNGTAALSGTPAAGTGGVYTLTIGADNGIAPAFTQTFTLSISEVLAITTADHATFTVGTPGTFLINTSGYPDPAITYTGSLPGGVTLIDNGNGTATLSGTPDAGSGGVYTLNLAADNGSIPPAAQTFTLTVNEAPQITSADNTTYTVGSLGSFTVTSDGFPTATLSLTAGSLPSGLTFTDNGDGTAALSGTPAAGSGGIYLLTFTAANGVSPDATQSFTLTVNEAPAFTSARATTFPVGTSGSFLITTNGYPAAAITFTGSLPSGVTLTDNGDGTATLSGAAPQGSGGVYVLSLTAANGVGADAAQTFTLTLEEAPDIISSNNATFEVGSLGSFTVFSVGYPLNTLSETGALPTGVTFGDNGDNTATLSGTPAAGTGGVYTITLTAANGLTPDASQTFTLTVNEAPSFTSPDNASFQVGAAGSFTITTTGYPAAAIFTNDSLPSGLTLTNNGDGTATIAGTPAALTGGVYTILLGAGNGINPDASQTFTLTISEAPQITSLDNTTFTVGALGSFTVTSTGYPLNTLSETGALPTGVTFLDNGDNTAALSGTPAAGSGGVYTITLGAANGVLPDASQTFTLTVLEAPSFTSADNAVFQTGVPGSFTITTNGYPLPAITFSGSFPGSLALVDNGDGTATLSGTPGPFDGGVYTFQLAAANGVSPDAAQTFTLTIGQPPSFTSLDNASFTANLPGLFLVTTSGYPAASITLTSGTLPGGLTLTDNGNGTAFLAGIPDDGTGGVYVLTLGASNGLAPDASQTFTLTMRESPSITSANAATFLIGQANSFTVTTDGFPTATVNYVLISTLPSSILVTDNGDGTATLFGTPLPGDCGTYTLSWVATNGVLPPGLQTFTLTIYQAPQITSAANTAFTVGTLGSFGVTSLGCPVNTLMETGALPAVLSFLDNADNSGLLSGTPADGTGGVYPLTLTAQNLAGIDTQAFTLTINEPPTFTSADHATFAEGAANSFTITTDGYPAAAITFTGALPAGVTLVDNGDGTAALSGTPAAGSGGVYVLQLTGANGFTPDASQTFTLTVTLSPVFTSANNTIFVTGNPGSFTITTSGFPVPAITSSGALPAGVTLVDNGDGTATLSGTPAVGSTGTFVLSLTAANGILPNGAQTFTLTVQGPPGVSLINSVADTGDGLLAEGEHTSAAITQLLVTFSKDMNALDAAAAANYSLTSGTTTISIDSAAYDNLTYTVTLNLNGGAALPDGAYTLTVKGSIRDTLGAPIGTDFVRIFYVDTVGPQVLFFLTGGNALITDGATLGDSFSSILVQFNEDVANPAGNAGDDVTNPANYLLFQAGADGTLETVSCTAGVATTDVAIAVGPVSYPYAGGAPFTAQLTVNNGARLPNGTYHIIVCGSTSIVDLAGNPLNSGADAGITFTISQIEEAEVIPSTGFAPGVITLLPPAAVAYKDLGNLWIEIPSQGVKAGITGVPFENDTWNVTWLYDQVGWLQGTSYPTWAGNTVLTAHAYTADGLPGPFAALKSLKYNDKIIIHYNGMRYTYALRGNFLTAPTNTSWITRHEKLDWITLITCQQYNEKTQSYTYRRVVRAVLVNVGADY